MQLQHTPLLPVVLLLLLLQHATALVSQDTLYDFDNRTLYLYLHNHDADDVSHYGSSLNKIYRIPFNTRLASGDVLNCTIAAPPQQACDVLIASAVLYSLCPSQHGLLGVSKYDHVSDSWKNVTLRSNIEYFSDATYLYTDSDRTGIYIFSGTPSSDSQSLSTRMIRLDTTTWESSNATSQVQPSPFYKSTALQINSNTLALFGGVSSDNQMVSMMEIPVWQYNSWAERPCNISSAQDVQPRTGSLVLPVFSETNQFAYNDTSTDFEVSSVLMIGGIGVNNTDVYPKIAALNVSRNVWEWEDLSNDLILADNSNAKTGVKLSLDSILAAGIIYDTLLTISVSPSSSSASNNSISMNKRSLSSEFELTIQLYNATNLKRLSEVDYTTIAASAASVRPFSHSNKNLTIALSVIIPILVIIILTCLVVWLYKRYRKRQEDERNEKEIREIVDFYENQHKQFSETTFSSYDSDYKSHGGSDYDFEKININNYDDSDDLSLNSWRRKRQDFQRQKSLFSIVKPKVDNLPDYSSNSVRRSLSVASNFISHSLKRSASTQSSIATFVTAKSSLNQFDIGNDNINNAKYEFDNNANINGNVARKNSFENDLYTIHSDESTLSPTLPSPPPAIPKHTTLVSFPNRTSSTLNHIPEEASVSTFHSQTLGFIPMKQAYNSSLVSLPQHHYMQQIFSPTIDSSLTNSSSVYSYNSKSARRPLSMISTSTMSSNVIVNPYLTQVHTENTRVSPPYNSNDYDEQGSIADDVLDNMEVQILVGSKRRSKLRVVNPDEDEESLKDENDIVDISKGLNKDRQIEEKSRCSSSSKEQGEDNEVRKRVISDEYHDESFL
ncbi:hypothetical protein PICMEDRAFT_69984 [Pichia membranifaciens NRRL Y-2026]|uniref:Uncharacterized protein n=1 Tax=Pichia membranifaciens NRRL Y-2026 TaxID=763406 RepID=A0A1E3NQF1_9ASCO|nr:hypothetical protein PICMEDRAFT_69984 [Pichia membranifaciens NRRL Y-2026]ODQ48337.1 hypothetical protein PICMEDRAFT_69984 [Pichia membranifaciens NRRL Y-2026]